jgi:hypothetical protein
MDERPTGDLATAGENVDEASQESFPASDSPAWTGAAIWVSAETDAPPMGGLQDPK